MKGSIAIGILTVLLITVLSACGKTAEPSQSQKAQDLPQSTVPVESKEENVGNTMMNDVYTIDTAISDVMDDPVFGDYGRLIFPVEDWYYSGDTLGELELTYYSNIDPDKTVEIANYFHNHAAAGSLDDGK